MVRPRRLRPPRRTVASSHPESHGAEIGRGEGFQTFADLDSAVAAIERVNSDYRKHCLAARRLAEDTFATDKVLPRFLADVFN